MYVILCIHVKSQAASVGKLVMINCRCLYVHGGLHDLPFLQDFQVYASWPCGRNQVCHLCISISFLIW